MAMPTQPFNTKEHILINQGFLMQEEESELCNAYESDDEYAYESEEDIFLEMEVDEDMEDDEVEALSLF